MDFPLDRLEFLAGLSPVELTELHGEARSCSLCHKGYDNPPSGDASEDQLCSSRLLPYGWGADEDADEDDPADPEPHLPFRLPVCGHVFGESCLKDATTTIQPFRRESAHRCPVCKRDLFIAPPLIDFDDDVETADPDWVYGGLAENTRRAEIPENLRFRQTICLHSRFNGRQIDVWMNEQWLIDGIAFDGPSWVRVAFMRAYLNFVSDSEQPGELVAALQKIRALIPLWTMVVEFQELMEPLSLNQERVLNELYPAGHKKHSWLNID